MVFFVVVVVLERFTFLLKVNMESTLEMQVGKCKEAPHIHARS